MVTSALTSTLATSLGAARDAASAQVYPSGTLYVVATPIGNLADISLRALWVLQLVDAVACEDTRHTHSLLRAYGMERSNAQLLAVHQHNEAQAAQDVVQRLQMGERIAYVSDAGTPGVSDPGARLVAAVQAAGLRTVPLPGASSVTAALSVAGISAAHDWDSQGFVFAGFLPSKAQERANAVATIGAQARAVVLLEAPHRIHELAQALAALGPRPVTVAREITKQFEQIATLPAQELTAWLDQDANRSRGEFALVVHPAEVVAQRGEGERVLKLLLPELALKTAVKIAAEISGESKNALYDLALTLKNQG